MVDLLDDFTDGCESSVPLYKKIAVAGEQGLR